MKKGDFISFSYIEAERWNGWEKLGVYVVEKGKEPVQLGTDYTAGAEWSTANQSLLEYEGKTVRIAFVHHNSPEQRTLALDCITLWNDRVDINEENFPDSAFRSCVGSIAKKEYFLYSELSSITTLGCQAEGIKDLTGVEYFTELTELWGSGNVAEVENLTIMPETFILAMVTEVNGGRFSGRQVVYDPDAAVMTYTYQCMPGTFVQFKLKLPPIPVDEAHFRDARFRQKVGKYAVNGMLDRERANGIEYLDVYGSQISDLTGIEFFPNLTTLNCSDHAGFPDGQQRRAPDALCGTALSGLKPAGRPPHVSGAPYSRK